MARTGEGRERVLRNEKQAVVGASSKALEAMNVTGTHWKVLSRGMAVS